MKLSSVYELIRTGASECPPRKQYQRLVGWPPISVVAYSFYVWLGCCKNCCRTALHCITKARLGSIPRASIDTPSCILTDPSKNHFSKRRFLRFCYSNADWQLISIQDIAEMAESVNRQTNAESTLEGQAQPIPSDGNSISPSIPSVDDQDSHVSTATRGQFRLLSAY